ncbi:hypothetical protein ANANG_G00163160 [Anguilla anguilla]|uniref:ATP-dependent rRNA helicase SPB4-like C-terminal extension domain-containing protein n=1 Tax=Anguilla anguilla TaxID=7936 RepID=A0A9D3RVE2_ANGAN|nr:hypothetical protein ANANG_G00163160 [Anguilla anguilla]
MGADEDCAKEAARCRVGSSLAAQKKKSRLFGKSQRYLKLLHDVQTIWNGSSYRVSFDAIGAVIFPLARVRGTCPSAPPRGLDAGISRSSCRSGGVAVLPATLREPDRRDEPLFLSVCPSLRYKEGGEALLVLLPSEEKGMIAQLQERKVPINKIQVNPEKLNSVQQKLEAFLAQEKEQKERAQRCFVSYLRSVYLMKNKDVFDVFQLPLEEYAGSLGLAVAPRVRFLNNARKQREGGEAGPGGAQGDESDQELRSFRAQIRGEKNTPVPGKGTTKSQDEPSEEEDGEEESGSEEEEESGDSDEEEEEGAVDGPARLSRPDGDEDEEEDLRDVDLLTVKRRDIFQLEEEDEDDQESAENAKKKQEKESRFKEAKKALKRNFKVNTKMTFTEDGQVVQQWPPLQRTAAPAGQEEEEDGGVSGINVQEARERLRREDQEFDKLEYSRKVKQKHREKRLKEKAERREASKRQKEEQKGESDSEEEEEEAVAYLDRGDGEEEFDPSSLPDPDKHVDSEPEDQNREASGKGARKRSYSESSSESDPKGLAAGRKRTRKAGATETAAQPLDTGLSLAEDEELVLHLLSHRS